MGTLTLSLSHPQSVERFEAWAQQFLCEQGYWSSDIEQLCMQQAHSMGVHRLDAPGLALRAKDSAPVREAFAEAARNMPHQLWFELNPPLLFRAVVVVDNSDSTHAHSEAILAYLQLLEQEVGSSGVLDFWAWDVPVENRSVFSRHRFANASLFGPVWKRLKEQLKCGAYTHAIVLGSGRLFDLEDYVGDEHLEQVLFVPVENGLTGGVVPERWLNAQQIANALAPGPTSILVGAPGVLPVWWDNPNYWWNGERLELRAQSNGQLASARLRSGWLCAGESVPSACSTPAKSGEEQALPICVLPTQESKMVGGFKATVSNGNREVVLPLGSCESNGKGHSLRRYRFDNGAWISSSHGVQAKEETHATASR